MSYELGKDIVKGIASIVKKVKDAKLQSELNEIQSKIFEMQQDMFDLQEKNNELKKQVQDTIDDKQIESRIKRSKGTVADYTTEQGEQIKICTACWYMKRKIVQVFLSQSSTDNMRVHKCPVCNDWRYYDV